MTSDAALENLADGIAGGLGDGWTARRTKRIEGVYLVHREEGSILVRPRRNDRSRLEVRGWADPMHPRQGVLLMDLDLGSITVAMSRGGEAIAKEIRRRLLPVYRTALVAYRARLEENLAADDKLRAEVARRLADALGTEALGNSVDVEPLGKFWVLRDGRVKMEITVQPGEAVRIARLLVGSSDRTRVLRQEAGRQADPTAHGDSNDAESNALRDALDIALDELGIERVDLSQTAEDRPQGDPPPA